MVKLGRGFYCGLIDTIPNKPPVFCINGFFMAMRAEYLADSASVHYFLVEWDNAAMSWSDFRKKVIGGTNPSFAHPESLRSLMTTRWEELGLDGPLDMMRNGIHASASAFEALVERSIWLRISAEGDALGTELMQLGLTPEVMTDWMSNVSVNGKPMFDHMDGKGSRDCLKIAKHLLLDRVVKRKFWIFIILNDAFSSAHVILMFCVQPPLQLILQTPWIIRSCQVSDCPVYYMTLLFVEFLVLTR
jgi:hypothetical protein